MAFCTARSAHPWRERCDGVADSAPQEAIALARQREALQQMFAEADSLPNENPSDTFNGADHDLVLYGWKK